MTAAASGRVFCVHCDGPIRGEAVRIEPVEAGSGAHPDNYRHESCAPRTGASGRRGARPPR
ncbi:hypothetical protein AB0A69_23720 [Streptomyces sp. NPDC045431]|uniref:hypothetical protein n=1 Tax=Streptomyces sp. NPDC045431 TaxID=3155613 RepID=UPI0034037532